ncbi:hypothetical protein EGW08_002239 [Elysia chlorotica]|uniref:Glycine N-acyltransferase-like protein n=1 Tax=Elysia chlorotica TaxID=188477 RepID=A0A3S1AES7_ELYCH|nr:hypothetical protein EGW08_002239 [Elysia chlorotica]
MGLDMPHTSKACIQHRKVSPGVESPGKEKGGPPEADLAGKHRRRARSCRYQLDRAEEDQPKPAQRMHSMCKELDSDRSPGLERNFINILARVIKPKEMPFQVCGDYLNSPRTTAVFSPDPDHLKKLLLWPGFFDWEKTIDFQVVSPEVTHVFQEIAKMKGGMLRLSDYTLFEMGKEEPPTFPEGFWVGPLDPDLHTDFVEGRWKYSRKNSNVYIRELLKKFPSAGVFNKHDELVGCTLGNEYGTLAMGHIDEEYRRFGLCAHMVSSVARAYFRDGLPSHALTLPDNTPVKRCCVRSGLKELRLVHWMIYYKGDEQASIKELGF